MASRPAGIPASSAGPVCFSCPVCSAVEIAAPGAGAEPTAGGTRSWPAHWHDDELHQFDVSFLTWDQVPQELVDDLARLQRG